MLILEMEVAVKDDKDIRIRLFEDGVMTCAKTKVETIFDNVNRIAIRRQKPV